MKEKIISFIKKEKIIIDKDEKSKEKYKIENILKRMTEIYTNYQKKKIIHILKSNIYSGAEKVVIDIINNLKGEDFNFVYVSPKGKITEKLKEENINYIHVKRLTPREIRKIVNKEQPDIIHAHDYTASVITAISGVKTKIISHLHNNAPWIKQRGIYSILYYITTKKYCTILTVSNAIMSEYVYGKKLAKKVIMVQNPIDSYEIVKKSGQVSANTSYDILFLGRLAKSKNPIRYIELIKKVKKKFPQIKAAMIGDGELIEECRRMIQKLNLENNITLLGFMNNPYEILKNSKMLLITSNWEGYSLAAIEAVALGVPVIANNVGGISEIIDENCGKLVNSNQEFLKEIELLLQNNSVLQYKKNQCLEKIKLLENKELYYKKIKELYIMEK